MAEKNFDSFNAPQFYDFNKAADEDNIDAYFEYDHEVIVIDSSEGSAVKNSSECFEVTYEDDKFYTPKDYSVKENIQLYEKRGNLRKSMSTGNLNLAAWQSGMKNDKTEMQKNKYSSKDKLTKAKPDSAKKPARDSRKLTRGMSSEHLNKLAQPKRSYSSDKQLNSKDFYSTAELVRKFEIGGNIRSRSSDNIKPKRTVPQSPALKCKARSRPVYVLSALEKEKLEFEEAQKYKVKARPVNKKILQGPMKPVHVEKKPNTVVEPFKITEPQPKVLPPAQTEQYKFQAHPVPENVIRPPKLKPVALKALTQPQTPTFLKHLKENTDLNKQEMPKIRDDKKVAEKSGKTIPKPFSFENRDKKLLAKKEEALRKLQEEETKGREFHANPVPKSMLKSFKLIRSRSANSFDDKITKSDENLSTQFKAKPALVLHQPPFIPKHDKRHFIKPMDFQLSTEQRSKEREEFERQKREKEEKLALYKELEEQERLRREEEEVAMMRKQSEYKAQPIRNFKPVIIQPSGKITEPISPKFHTDRKRNVSNLSQDNKENSC